MANGFLRTKMTESPRRNIFEMNRSLLTGFTFFFPFPVRGTSVHISLTLKRKEIFNKNSVLKILSAPSENAVYLSKTMLQCRSNALTRPRSFLLLRQLISTWVLFLTDCVNTDSGPVLNSSSSCRANSSGVNSDFGFARALYSSQVLRLCVRAFDSKTFGK